MRFEAAPLVGAHLGVVGLVVGRVARRGRAAEAEAAGERGRVRVEGLPAPGRASRWLRLDAALDVRAEHAAAPCGDAAAARLEGRQTDADRKSTRLNSSH